MDTYQGKATRPARSDQLSVAVVGAGISGLFAARTLADHGLEVRVFDKSRGSGGRCSTRRDVGGDGFVNSFLGQRLEDESLEGHARTDGLRNL